MLPEQFIWIGVIINLAGALWYIKHIVWGTTRPNLVSWFIWTLAPFIAVFFEIKAGAGLSVMYPFMAGFSSLLVIVLSLFRRNAIWKISTLDIICGVLALIALVFYVLTHNLAISIIFAILSDGLAAAPTLIKTWKFPETENSVTYTTGIINAIISLLVIKNWIFSIYSFNIYLMAMNLVIIFCIYRKKIFNMLYFNHEK